MTGQNSTKIPEKPPQISCVILSCDSHINKGSSIRHALVSVFNQTFTDFELILIENSHQKPDIQALHAFCEQENSRRKHKIPYQILNNSKSLSWGAARNRGVEQATGKILVFLDDDTIILDSTAFETIAEKTKTADYGYGAKRSWTKDNWFQENTHEILKQIQENNTAILHGNSTDPQKGVRGYDEIDLQCVTFIANFGFCRRDLFQAVGGFPDYGGYGFEDDNLMFKCFNNGYRFALLDELSVIHVNHPIVKTKQRSLIPYFEELIRNGYYWFHVAKTFSKTPPARGQVLERLRPVHYDYRIEDAYESYLTYNPLNLTGQKEIALWREQKQLSLLQFTRIIKILQDAPTIDAFIKNSEADVDNLAPVIKTAKDENIIAIDKDGTINPKFTFKFTTPNEPESLPEPTIEPKQAYNQFPCDSASRLRRVELLKERYPFAEYLQIGIIGDDDFLSAALINDIWARPIVIEKDPDVVKGIKQTNPRANVYEEDVLNREAFMHETVQTFITDPPYTFHGALAFAIAGLSMLPQDQSEKECYLILNKQMMGVQLSELIALFASVGVILTEVVENFSHYQLPETFDEKKRAKTFLSSNTINECAIEYSSSSNLYVFTTRQFQLKPLVNALNPNKLYDHFATGD